MRHLFGTSRQPSATRHRSDARGQAETLGFVLLIGIAVIGTAVILVLGSSALGGSQHAAEVSHSEHAMKQFDSRASRVALGKATVQQVDLAQANSDSALRTKPDAGWMRVEFINATTGRTNRTVASVTLGAVEIDHGETTVAYQGGGVWRADREGSVMVSRPEFHYQRTENGTLTLPIIVVEGDDSVHSRVELTKNGSAERRFPDRTKGWENTVNNTKVFVTVQSDYYRGWGKYFEESTNAIVTYDHEAGTVTAKFLSLPRYMKMRNGIIATAESGRLELKGTGAYTDSYDSAVGPYSDSQRGGGTVEAVGDVYMTGNSEVQGNIRSGAAVDLGSSATVDGDIYYTESYDQGSATVTGSVSQIDGVASVEPIDGMVYQNVAEIRAANNNSETGLITDGSLSLSKGESGTLGAGRYHVDSMELSGGDLTLDTTNGDIAIAVENWIKLERNGGDNPKLNVEGDGVVRIYVASQEETNVSITGLGDRQVNLHLDKKSRVSVGSDDRSTQLRLYGPRDFKATIAGDNSPPETEFNGLIYAPSGRTGTGYTYIKQGDVYGGVVTGMLTIGQYGAVHYDENISTVPLPRSPTAARLEYLHVGVHRLHVTAA